MEIAFESQSLRLTCEDLTTAKFALGDMVAEALQHRLADLQAAVSINDLIVGNCRIVGMGDAQRVYMDLPKDHHMVLAANHPRKPLTPQGDLDWMSVTRIKIIFIGGDHDRK